MSELLEAAAQAVGAPEELVLRSAEARAGADGIPVDDVLAAWAGGAPVPASSPPPQDPAPASPPPAPDPAETTAAVSAAPAEPVASSQPDPVPEAPQVTPPPVVVPSAPVPSGPPPVLKGRQDRPFRYLFGAAALLILSLVVTVVLPPLSGGGRGAFHSEIPYSEAALGGQTEYLAEGCVGCHTQLVRPIVADAQLAALAGQGAVTLADTNQVIGRQRYGPDLANVGARLGAEEIEEVLTGKGGHVLYSGDRMEDLVAYLTESKAFTEESSHE